MKRIARPPEPELGKRAGKALMALPATDRLPELSVDTSHADITHIRSPKGRLNKLYHMLEESFHNLGYSTPHLDMEREWMRDSEGFNRSLRARFEIQKNGKTVAAVELRSFECECDHIMVCSSSKSTPPEKLSVGFVVLAAIRS